MQIAELFYSIQGEGILTGVPSVFIRTAGCNLNCRWCDTAYAQTASRGHSSMHVAQIMQQVRGWNASHAVITGGEPLLQDGTWELARQLKSNHMHVTIESNATLHPRGIACDLASLSPKLTSSYKDVCKNPGTSVSFEMLREWLADYVCQLKFVVAEQQDIEEIKDILHQLNVSIPSETVLLMPEAATLKKMNQLNDLLIRACKEYGFRYCRRVQIDVFGSQKGK